METPTPLTELEAINAMLEAIGEAPVNTLSISVTTDVAIARSVLYNTVRDVCQTPWHFNTEHNYPLLPDGLQQIVLPSNMIRVDLPSNQPYDVVVRGNRLYDRTTHSFVFTQTLYATVQWYLKFEDLPETARHFVMIRAMRRFQDRVLGDNRLHQYTEDDEREAYRRLKQFETSSGDYNLFRNESSRRILRRTRYD